MHCQQIAYKISFDISLISAEDKKLVFQMNSKLYFFKYYENLVKLYICIYYDIYECNFMTAFFDTKFKVQKTRRKK